MIGANTHNGSQLSCSEFKALAASWVELRDIFQSAEDFGNQEQSNNTDTTINTSLFEGPWNWELKKLQGQQCYLAMRVCCVIPPPQSNDEGNGQDLGLEMYEDPSCQTDDACATIPAIAAASSRPVVLRGWIHVLLHPVYQVPCPYIQLRLCLSGERDICTDANTVKLQREEEDERGAVLSVAALDMLLRRASSARTDIGAGTQSQPQAEPEDVLVLIEEEHPFLGVPAACLHICGLSDRLAILQGQVAQWDHQQPQSQAETQDEQGGTVVSDGGDGSSLSPRRLYLLQWFSLVAPLLGLPPLPAALFQRATTRLLHPTTLSRH